jgi:hypothetical protein
MFNSFFLPICNIVNEASVRFSFPPLKMYFKKNLTTQQAVGGGVGGGWETTQKERERERERERVIAGRFLGAQKQRLQVSKQIRY